MELSTERRRRVTINTVAEAAGVSRQTVTNVLLHPERVNPATLVRVLQQIELLGYRPSAAAKTLRGQRVGAIGVELNSLGPDYHNATMAPLVSALSVRAHRHGFHVVTFGSSTDSPMTQSYETMWSGQLVDAFVIADTHHGDPRPAWLQERRIPFASFGRVWDDPTFMDWVDVDGAAGTRAAAEHCLAAGYRRIAYLGWPDTHSAVGDSRQAGWEAACRAAGPSRGGGRATAVDDVAEGRSAARALLADLVPGDAVVCASDVLAVAVLMAVQDAGLRPGTDIGIVGFDDSETARMFGLSSISQSLDLVADRLLSLVGERLAPPAPDQAHRSEGVLLAPTLTPRASTDPGAGSPAPHHPPSTTLEGDTA